MLESIHVETLQKKCIIETTILELISPSYNSIHLPKILFSYNLNFFTNN